MSATYAENRRGGETATVSFYDVSQSITSTLRDLGKVAELTTAVLGAGATAVGEASLRLSEPGRARDEVRAQAARDAREKAVALATELGAKVGRPLKVTEAPDGELGSPTAAPARPAMVAGGTGRSAPAAPEDTPTVFAPGLLTIAATVNVTFLLE